jgi:hypothetical protein
MESPIPLPDTLSHSCHLTRRNTMALQASYCTQQSFRVHKQIPSRSPKHSQDRLQCRPPDPSQSSSPCATSPTCHIPP